MASLLVSGVSEKHQSRTAATQSTAKLEHTLKCTQPQGYSAIRTARQLAPGGLLLCIEANPDNAATARQIIDYAGVGGRVVILGGLGSEKLPEAAQLLAERPAAGGGAAASGGSGGDSVLARLRRQAAERAAAPAADVSDGGGDEAAAAAAASQAAAAAAEAVAGSQVDYLFLDHCKPCYLPDLLAAERLGLVGAGTVVAADNVVYPGARVLLALLVSISWACGDFRGSHQLCPCPAALPVLVAATLSTQQPPSPTFTSSRPARQSPHLPLLKPRAASPLTPSPGAPGYLEHLDAAGRYATVLLDAPHEVDKPWDPKWRMGEPDAVAVSLRW